MLRAAPAVMSPLVQDVALGKAEDLNDAVSHASSGGAAASIRQPGKAELPVTQSEGPPLDRHVGVMSRTSPAAAHSATPEQTAGAVSDSGTSQASDAGHVPRALASSLPAMHRSQTGSQVNKGAQDGLCAAEHHSVLLAQSSAALPGTAEALYSHAVHDIDGSPAQSTRPSTQVGSPGNAALNVQQGSKQHSVQQCSPEHIAISVQHEDGLPHEQHAAVGASSTAQEACRADSTDSPLRASVFEAGHSTSEHPSRIPGPPSGTLSLGHTASLPSAANSRRHASNAHVHMGSQRDASTSPLKQAATCGPTFPKVLKERSQSPALSQQLSRAEVRQQASASCIFTFQYQACRRRYVAVVHFIHHATIHQSPVLQRIHKNHAACPCQQCLCFHRGVALQ